MHKVIPFSLASFFGSVLWLGLSATVSAKAPQDHLAWQKLSQATATWLFMDIYTAELFVDKQSPKPTQTDLLGDSTPLQLKLCYLKSIDREQIIEAAEHALPTNLSPAIQADVTAIHQAYRSVKPGDCYQLSYQPSMGTTLSFNGSPVFQSKQAGFKATYFGIWLGKNPLSESVKSQLIGKL